MTIFFVGGGMYVYAFLAYVSDSQTLAHIIWNHLEDLLKCILLGFTQRVSYSVSLGCALRICFPNKFPYTDGINPGTTF